MIRLFCFIVVFLFSSTSFAFNNMNRDEWGFSSTLTTASTDEQSTGLRHRIMDEYSLWKGTRYLWGGDSREGIDCSAFTRRILGKTLHRHLPRTAIEQSHIGHFVNEGQLKAGDLVFFMTKPDVRHVGVYVGKGRFIHASSSHGVMVSYLSNNYWQDHFLTARRISV
ncbi:C40 family peptidase [Kluyvera chengduensis]|uniref:C40 family peptidase n=1 Tax=Kluyvera sp. 142359 TaxID=3375726 RepID=UPI0037758C89